MNTNPQQGEPQPKEGEGGKSTHWTSSVTWQQLSVGLAVVAAVVGAVLYLESRFNGVTRAVGENTERLAIVETEVKALRRDMGRVEADIGRIEKNTNPTTVGMLD